MEKIFIGGPSNKTKIDGYASENLLKFKNDGYTFLVSDQNVVIQNFFLGYDKVVVYANGEARNNVGSWEVKTVKEHVYLAMIEDCDYGCLFYDGKTQESADNVENYERLIFLQKKCLVFELEGAIWQKPKIANPQKQEKTKSGAFYVSRIEQATKRQKAILMDGYITRRAYRLLLSWRLV